VIGKLGARTAGVVALIAIAVLPTAALVAVVFTGDEEKLAKLTSNNDVRTVVASFGIAGILTQLTVFRDNFTAFCASIWGYATASLRSESLRPEKTRTKVKTPEASWPEAAAAAKFSISLSIVLLAGWAILNGLLTPLKGSSDDPSGPVAFAPPSSLWLFYPAKTDVAPPSCCQGNSGSSVTNVTVNVTPGDGSDETKTIKIEPPVIKIDPPVVRVEPPQINVGAPTINLEANIQAPSFGVFILPADAGPPPPESSAQLIGAPKFLVRFSDDTAIADDTCEAAEPKFTKYGKPKGLDDSIKDFVGKFNNTCLKIDSDSVEMYIYGYVARHEIKGCEGKESDKLDLALLERRIEAVRKALAEATGDISHFAVRVLPGTMPKAPKPYLGQSVAVAVTSSGACNALSGPVLPLGTAAPQ
jgi:hypothetical protein